MRKKGIKKLDYIFISKQNEETDTVVFLFSVFFFCILHHRLVVDSRLPYHHMSPEIFM